MDQLLKAVAHPVRRRLLALLWDGPRPAGKLAAEFELSGPTVSGHLKVLLGAGLVTAEAEGTTRWYSLKREALQGLERELFQEEFRELFQPATGSNRAPRAVESSQRSAFEVTAAVEIRARAKTVYRYASEEKYFRAWMGEDAICSGVVGGPWSATLAWGGRAAGEHVALAQDHMVINRFHRPANLDGTLLYWSVTPTGRNSCQARFTHYVYDAQAASILGHVWPRVLADLRHLLHSRKRG